MRLHELDLNLLFALDALLEEGSVTKAARRVGITQPAMSNALKRLRLALGDELLVRAGSGMVPTPRAVELAGPLREALGTLQRALDSDAQFDPETATRSFRIASTDYAELVLLPELAARLRDRAPSVDLFVRALEGEVPRNDLESGDLDLAVGVFPDPPAGHVQQGLFRDRFVCVVREDHPRVPRGGLDLETYCRLEHILIAPRGEGPGIVDNSLARQGRARRIAVRVPHFLVAPLLVAKSDMVLTLASRVACQMAPVLGLRILQPPLELPTFTIRQIWHGRYRHDPAHRFLRGLVAEVARDVAEPGACLQAAP